MEDKTPSGEREGAPPLASRSTPPPTADAKNPFCSPQTTIVQSELQRPSGLGWSTRVILFVVGFSGAVLLYLVFYWWVDAPRHPVAPVKGQAPTTSVIPSDGK